jgi:hypothetical protein
MIWFMKLICTALFANTLTIFGFQKITDLPFILVPVVVHDLNPCRVTAALFALTQTIIALANKKRHLAFSRAYDGLLLPKLASLLKVDYIML